MANQLSIENISYKLGFNQMIIYLWTLNILEMIIVAISVFEKVGKYYPQGYLHQFFHELQNSCTKIALTFLKDWH